ncbi:MAG: TetR/AcrR family transcriptional regulator [Halieaceae bacterium]
MVESRIQTRKARMAHKRQPVQERSRQRREEILRATAALLEQVGFDDLTTILIAREMAISVGSLYHYFPNKQAILYAMGEQWLEQYSVALEDVAALPLEQLDQQQFVAALVPRLLTNYQDQRGMLPLVQAMWSVPELRDLDEAHDDMVISRLSNMFRRLGLAHSRGELERRARMCLEMTHALLLSITEQTSTKAKRSAADLQALCLTLLNQP